MKHIINNKLYDTDKATELVSWKGNFGWYYSLCKTKKDNYFKWSTLSADESIIELTKQQAIDLFIEQSGSNIKIIEKLFNIKIEEA